MKIPCKNCICLPACLNKEKVFCDILEDVAAELDKEIDEICIEPQEASIMIREWWEYVKEFLPKAKHIRRCDGTKKYK